MSLKNQVMRARRKFFLFRRLSIQQRLSLLICTPLLIAIVIYGFANYYSLKNATLIIGRERLNSFTTQLNSSFGLVTQSQISMAAAAAAQNSTIQYVKSGGKQFVAETLAQLNSLQKDSTWVNIGLFNADFAPLLYASKSIAKVNIDIKSLLSPAGAGPAGARIGNLYNLGGAACYPVISAVTTEKKVAGYIIAWKSVLINAKALAQFSQFVGIGADFYIGNADGSLWTNFINVIPAAPFKVTPALQHIEFNGADGRRMIADARVIDHTQLVFAIAIAEQTMLQSVNGFVKWVTLIGIVLMAIGILAAWLMARNITKPLNQLMENALAISRGNYSMAIPIDPYRGDELAKLAHAFNLMTGQVYEMHHNLESQVMERTLQLESANKELEAFSYSVSHDLRTPLRAINGYSVMLKEDYESKLDSEGNRILGNITNNAKMMGQLIDDLLSFSRLGKKDPARTHIDMQLLVKTVVNELLQHEPENKYHVKIALLPPAEADRIMIKQVLVNLLSNAIKYSSKKDSPEIEVGFKEEDSGTIYFVKDNGDGFDMKYAGKLFGVFQRLHSQEEFEGTGVGLALVKRVIDKHKGMIWADAAVNAGATFYFTLSK
jgi:signal transduction histidine kinase